MTRRLETPEQARERLGQQRLSEREQAELWARVSASAVDGGAFARRPARVWMLSLGLAAIGAALALFVLNEPTAPAAPIAKPVQLDPCALDSSASVLKLPVQCASKAVQIGGDEWQLEHGAEVARVSNGARVERGRVQFRVRPRKQAGDAPFVVKVSHAEVRVIGTVFVIDQQQSRGTVHVSEGVIEVVWSNGDKQRVAAGESASWPRPKVEPPAPQLQTPRATKALDLEAVMDRLLLLRSQKRFSEAAVLLRDTLATKSLGGPQRERISYELGLALDAGGAPSCQHWRKHSASFGDSRSKRALDAKLASCRSE